MFFLFLAITCSASIALIFKHSETTGLNRYVVTSVNYLTACSIAVILLVCSGNPILPDFAARAAWQEIAEAIVGGRKIVVPGASILWAVLCGFGAGAVFFLAFLYYQISVRRDGVGLSGAFAKLGILIPMSLSLVLWRELPSLIQWVGIGTAVASIVLVNWPGGDSSRKAVRPALILLLLFAGLAEFSNKVFQMYGVVEHKDFFLLTTFLVALVFSVFTAVRKGLPASRRDMVVGVAVRLPNLFSSYFLILALETMPAPVAFPLFGAGTILIITLAGRIVFGETSSGREYAAVALVILSIVLISL